MFSQEQKSHTRFTSIFRKRRNASRHTYAAASCAGATTDDTTSITTPSATVAPSAAAAADDARRAARRTSLKAARTATTKCDADNRQVGEGGVRLNKRLRSRESVVEKHTNRCSQHWPWEPPGPSLSPHNYSTCICIISDLNARLSVLLMRLLHA